MGHQIIRWIGISWEALSAGLRGLRGIGVRSLNVVLLILATATAGLATDGFRWHRNGYLGKHFILTGKGWLEVIPLDRPMPFVLRKGGAVKKIQLSDFSPHVCRPCRRGRFSSIHISLIWVTLVMLSVPGLTTAWYAVSRLWARGRR